jgi:hypothetical protein
MAEIRSHGGATDFDLRTIPPMKEFQFRIFEFNKGISDWSDAFTACGKLFQRQMALQFETEGAISGAKWRKNEEAYAEWKKSHGYGSKVGVRTGDLRRSMTGGGAGYYHEDIAATKASFGMSKTSPAREYGPKFSEGDTPDRARPVIRMTKEWGHEYQKVIHLWLQAEMGGMITGGSAVGGLVQRGGVANLRHSAEGLR